MADERIGDQTDNGGHKAEFYTVKRGDSLYKIAQALAAGSGEKWRELYAENNKIIGDDPDMIQPGQILTLPSNWHDRKRDSSPEKPSPLRVKAPQPQQPILIGSIIHLQNQIQVAPGNAVDRAQEQITDGGYLGILKEVTDEPLIEMYHEPSVYAFVATHANNERPDGSGRWQIFSADGAKQIGTPLVVGDKIHLRNMRPAAGYLDSFEWVERMAPFKDYPMQIGVFTSKEERGEGVSGTWTLQAAAGKTMGDNLMEGDVIELENDYPGAGFLYTYGEVTAHPLFSEHPTYTGQRLFVFTGPKPAAWHPGSAVSSSKQWQVTLYADNLYRIYHWRGDRSTPWHDGGTFLMGKGVHQPIHALRISSTDQGKTLSGKITWAGVEPPEEDNLRAVHVGQNFYTVTINGQAETEKWRLGAREYQRVVAMELTFALKQSSCEGKMTYRGEDAINVQGRRGITTPSDLSGPDNLSATLYAVPQPGWVKGRTNRVERAIVEIDNLLAATIAAMNSSSAASFDMLDRTFQKDQLSNLHTLSHLLNGFFRYTLHALMKQSVANHKQDNDGTVAPLHQFRACFQQVALDQAIIEQAVAQRGGRAKGRAGAEQEQADMGEWAVELLKLDKLAIKAIMPFRKLLVDGANPNDDLAIITYLSEKTHIHLVPYTKQFILIGVSYDRVPPAAGIFDDQPFIGKDFYAYEIMAIPHEVGHYMYQHGKVAGRPFPEFSRKFEDNPYYCWCEELFADVYSCIVAGPLAAISMQALLMSIDRDRAWKEDEEHPTPVLRVFIFAEILRILGQVEAKVQDEEKAKNANSKAEKAICYAFPDVIEKLDRDWTSILQLWRYDAVDNSDSLADRSDRPRRPVRVYMHDNSALHLESIVNVERVMKAIRPIIQDYVTVLYTFARDEANFGAPPAQRDQQLSLEIPWTRVDRTTTGPYNEVMAKMTDQAFARKTVSRQFIQDPKLDETHFDLSNPDEKVQHYLKTWGDRGPFGSGTGTYSVFSFYGSGLL